MLFCAIYGKVYLVFLFVMMIVCFRGCFLNKSKNRNKKVNNNFFELTLSRFVHLYMLFCTGVMCGIIYYI